MPNSIVFDRSRGEDFEHCPRKRWWSAEYKGRGIEQRAMRVPLLTGGLIHEPLAHILEVARTHGPIRGAESMPGAVIMARDIYMATVKQRGIMLDAFDGDDNAIGNVITDVNWQVEEQLALLEALVKGWCLLRLPALLTEFDILEVEQEYTTPLDGVFGFMARPDAVLKRKGSGELFVLNFKSVGDPNKTWMEQWRYESQTLSEVIGVEAKYEKKATGVLIEGLVKGRRNVQWPKDSGNWYSGSPLIWHWVKDEGPPFPPSFAASYEFKDEMGMTRRLGKGWERQLVHKGMGIDKWLMWLRQERPEVLQAQFISLPPILRSDFEVASWKRSAIAREERIVDGAAACRKSVDEAELEVNLDLHFPRHSAHGNCLRPSRCPFLELCFGTADPNEPSLFLPRVPNHPQEAMWRDWNVKKEG